MTELKAAGLVDMHDVNPKEYNSEKEICLKPEFEWFLSEKFRELRRCKEKYAPSNTSTNRNIIDNSTLDNTLLNASQEDNNTSNQEALRVHSSLHQNIPEYSCNYCQFQNANQQDYDKHTAIKHPGRAGYPDSNGRT